MYELTAAELDMVSGAGTPREEGLSDGEEFGEALEDIGDAIRDGWNWLVDRVT